MAKLSVDEAAARLGKAGWKVENTFRDPSGYGVRIDLAGGGNVTVFDTGKIRVQGKDANEIRQALGLDEATAPGSPAATSRNVFVVYGHDKDARTQLEAMLRRWRLEPLILDQLPSEGQTIIEKLEKYTNEGVRFAVVLATPDDEGHVRGKADEKRFRARQNVVLELGLLLDKLGRSRVAILLKDQENMERPSDIQGLIYIPFTDNVEDAKVVLAKEMDKQGLAIEVERL